jgi:hypothetical protein
MDLEATSMAINEDQQRFLAGIRCLSSACHHHGNVKYSKVMLNIVALASSVWWLGMVRSFCTLVALD